MTDSVKGHNNVCVAVRIRPLNQTERSAAAPSHAETVYSSNEVDFRLHLISPSDGSERIFNFDSVFGVDSSQRDVYNTIARPIIENVLEGYNGTILAYGQTGTGKTYTMQGDGDLLNANNMDSDLQIMGIIPNSFAHLFGQIARADKNVKFLVRVSYLEIYNEMIRDLLSEGDTRQHSRAHWSDTRAVSSRTACASNTLRVRECPRVGVYVQDLSTHVVHSVDDMWRVLKLGTRNRVTGATAMNEHSSRSHAIFTVIVEQSRHIDAQSSLQGDISCDTGTDSPFLKTDHIRMGKLHLVDLAGSERQKTSHSKGKRLREATNINLGLSALGNVISVLTDASKHNVTHQSSDYTVGAVTHIPYRNSKLTRLLQDSLGGNSKTVMIATVSPCAASYSETLSTLRYASRTRRVHNSARINEHPSDTLLQSLQDEIAELRRCLAESNGINTDKISNQSDDGEAGIHNDLQQKYLQEKIIKEQELLKRKNLAAEERVKLMAKLRRHEKQLSKSRRIQQQLNDKLSFLESKIIIGGVNLLDQAEEQEKLLELSAEKLKSRKYKEERLREALQKKEAERIDIQERYSTLHEESVGTSHKLRELHRMLSEAVAELEDLRVEGRAHCDQLIEHTRQLQCDTQLHQLVAAVCVPLHVQCLVREHSVWRADLQEWSCPGGLSEHALADTCVKSSRPQCAVADCGDEADTGCRSLVQDLLTQVDFSNVYLAKAIDTCREATEQTYTIVPSSSRRPRSPKPRHTHSRYIESTYR